MDISTFVSIKNLEKTGCMAMGGWSGEKRFK
jgi:hypothetical protein